MTRFFMTMVLLLSVSTAFADSNGSIGVLLDETPRTPMRVESQIIAELALSATNASSADGRCVDVSLLVPTESGIVTLGEGEKVDLSAFSKLLIYQGTEITQDSPLFSEQVVASIKSYLDSSENDGVLFLGGSVALLKPLGYAPDLKCAPLTFGEDRNQMGVAPVNPSAKLFENFEHSYPDSNIWLTNAAFPAFAAVSSGSPALRLLATSTNPAAPNPIWAICREEKSGEQSSVKAIAFGARVTELFNVAAPEFQRNFEQTIRIFLDSLGVPLDNDALRAPLVNVPDFDALERALDWFEDNFDEEEFPNLNDYRVRLQALRDRAEDMENRLDELVESQKLTEMNRALDSDFQALQKEATLANPELDFDSFLYVRRDPAQMGLPENYNSNSVLPTTGYRDELRKFNFRDGVSSLVFKPKNGEFVGDLELYYDASKVMFSSPDQNTNYRWRLWEQTLDSNGDPVGEPVLTPTIESDDVDNYDACYLPDDRLIFCSTACMTGVPCINGKGHVCNLYLKERDGSIRQLTLEQDHDWNPVVMNNGRVMYLRWEYVDLPHAFSRIMFHMNPDGTNQSELYGSGSYWPNGIFHARPLPGDSSKFVGIVTGHHELNRQGEMVIFDPFKGRKEASGVVQRVPGYGKNVSPIACDLPIEQSWPKFMNPYPVSENVFLASCKRSREDGWIICLVDVFDNIVPLLSEEGNATLEPIPLREIPRQPVLPDRVDLESQEADVFIADVYEGEGLKGVPRGEVKALRIFSYEFAYQGMGAEPYSVGLDGPWDPRRIIGTVPVLEDGSASFKIPAYTPIALQPLDAEGNALQIMRSWITALPGETVSCVGCHEPQNSTIPTNPRTLAAQNAPSETTPFYGPTRGFSFENEIQPILDKYCVECHSEKSEKVERLVQSGKVAADVWEKIKRPGESFLVGKLPDFTKTPPKPTLEKGNYIADKSPVSNSYYQLRRFVNTPTKESWMPTHPISDFHCDVQPIVQLLTSGHFGVELDPESWAKLGVWIDLNAPYFGNWGDMMRSDNLELVKNQATRREELRKLYAPNAIQLDDDPEVNFEGHDAGNGRTSLRVRFKTETSADPAIATSDSSPGSASEVKLSDGATLSLTRIPGTNLSVGTYEITNEQYRLFDPTHDSGIEYADFIQFSPGERGWNLNRDRQPVARVSYRDAVRFCEWLSDLTGDEYRLPTAAEWKLFASEPDASLENFADSTYGEISPFGWRGRVETLPGWRPVDWERNDQSRVSAPVGSYSPNTYGLRDVWGNVAEWTSTDVVETREVYDCETNKTIEEKSIAKKAVCGGSWRTRVKDADAPRAFRDYFLIRDVGFRVVRVEK